MNLALISKPGGGKTTVACQMPARKLLIDVDGKAKQMINLQEQIKSGELVIYTMKNALITDRLSDRALNPEKGLKKEPKGYVEILDVLNDIMDGKDSIIDGSGEEIPLQGYQTYILDTLSRLTNHMKRLLIYHRTNGKFGKFNSSTASDDVNWPSWGSYLANLEEFMEACTKYIPGHFVCCVHEAHKTTIDPLTGSEIDKGYWPMIQGSFRELFAGYFNEVYHLEGRDPKSKKSKDGKEWYLITSGKQYNARTSLNLDREELADLPEIFKKAGIYDQMYN